MLNLEILRKIDVKVDDDEFLKQAKDIADIALNQHIKQAQMRNLQNVVNSTTRFSEICNFVKSQTGRHKEWKKLGPKIIQTLNNLDHCAQDIVESENQEYRGEIRLHLCRHWVKMVVAEFLYGKEGEEDES